MRRSLFALAPAAIAVTIAGCGGAAGTGGSGHATSVPAAAKSKAAPAAAATVAVETTSLGHYLVDAHGRTLYLFEKDTGTASTCYSACASIWPPLTVSGAPKAGTGVLASKLGTTKRTDGQAEVTYNGHPLYYYAADTAPRQTQGQGLNQFGAPWYVVAPSGAKIDNG
jgi:predicted lipoprotein with Yx(FWY)xxD motif